MHLSDIQKRKLEACFVEHENGCCIYEPWLGGTSRKFPMFHIGNDKYISIRKWVYVQRFPDYKGNVFNTCGNSFCVAIEHLSDKKPLKLCAPPYRWTEQAVWTRFCEACKPLRDDCVLFRPHCRQRYPDFNYAHNKKMGAHRFAYIKAFGPIGDDAMVRHTCDKPKCVNPKHLILGYSNHNLNDAVLRRRHSGPTFQARNAGEKPTSVRIRPAVHMHCRLCNVSFFRKSHIYRNMLRRKERTLNYCSKTCFRAAINTQQRPFSANDREAFIAACAIFEERSARFEKSRRF